MKKLNLLLLALLAISFPACKKDATITPTGRITQSVYVSPSAVTRASAPVASKPVNFTDSTKPLSGAAPVTAVQITTADGPRYQ